MPNEIPGSDREIGSQIDSHAEATVIKRRITVEVYDQFTIRPEQIEELQEALEMLHNHFSNIKN